MYKVMGTDGKEYGPISLEQFSQWAAEGRVSPQTRVQPVGATDWTAAAGIPELQAIFARLGRAPTVVLTSPISPPASGEPQKGLAVTSLVLGILSLVCLGPLTGIPAIICGHIARKRSRQSPAEYGGPGMATAGLALGYASVALVVIAVVIFGGMLLPALSQAKGKAGEIGCANNMKMIGLSFRTWAIDHNDKFPFNVSTNLGGTLELCAPGPDGFDKNAAMHFLVMSNELSTPSILVCPSDKRPAAMDWAHLGAANVTYQVRSGEGVTDANPQQVLAVCPIHNNVLRADGSVQRARPGSRRN
jgi:competence protein ComGC